jgi:hypothetical protein
MEMKHKNGVFGGTPPPQRTDKKKGLFGKMLSSGTSAFK